METSGLENLTPKEYQFIDLLLQGDSVEQAGDAINISRRTAFLWKKKSHIQAALEAGRQGRLKIVEQVQCERVKLMLPQVSILLEDAAPRALKKLLDLMDNAQRDETQLKAAVELLKLSGIEKSTQVQTTECSAPTKGLTPEAADEIRRKILGIEV